MPEMAPVIETVTGWPQWLDRYDSPVKDGRDPLGLDTITTDRIAPLLLPGILALSEHARYFSFHVFLLDEYRRRRLPSSPRAQSDFVRRREFDFGAAVLRCSRCDQPDHPSPLGALTLRPLMRRASGPVARGESVESFLGGYGLYYRSPLRDLGLVAPRGTVMDGGPIPVDILTGARAENLAKTFRETIEPTEYYRRYFHNDDPVPLGVLEEVGNATCLCRLPEQREELTAVCSAFFDVWERVAERDVTRRLRAFAMALRLMQANPAVAADEANFRRECWRALRNVSGEEPAWADTVGGWAALYGKEYMQEGLRVIWRALNVAGRQHAPAEGLAIPELDALVRDHLAAPVTLAIGGERVPVVPEMSVTDFADLVRASSSGLGLEDLRAWALSSNHPLAGVALLLVLSDRIALAAAMERGSSWQEIGWQDGGQQPGLLRFVAEMRRFTSVQRSVAELLAWIVKVRILLPHDRIAMGKLPEFTFRFRLAGGRVQFYSRPSIDFGLASSRFSTIMSLSREMAFWERTPNGGQPTEAGHALIERAF